MYGGLLIIMLNNVFPAGSNSWVMDLQDKQNAN